MSEEHSLLAYLVPRLTSGVEDAATDALAFILNRSALCRDALAEMVTDGEHRLKPLERASTQVTVDDGGRLDLVAYDADDLPRLIIESKFWAALLSSQASGYVRQLATDGQPATLLFVAPEIRRETLWPKIEGQFAQTDDLQLAESHQDDRLRVADVTCVPSFARWRVALTSWYALLNRLESADSSMVANIRQLRSLANAQDDKAFAPLHADDFNPAIPRRHLDFCRLLDDVIGRGWSEDWISVEGLRATAQRDGYVRFFQFCAEEGKCKSSAIALYFSADRWMRSGTTPIWLRCWHEPEQIALARQTQVEYEKDPGGPVWVSLRLLTGVEYPDVLADVVAQVKRIREVLIEYGALRAGDPAAPDSGETGESDSGIEDGADPEAG